jgi:hypothetical protein
MSRVQRIARCSSEAAARPDLRLVPSWPARGRSSWDRSSEHTIELNLTFRELTLIHRSLQATKTLGVFAPQDELFNDTIQFVDQALNEAV